MGIFDAFSDLQSFQSGGGLPGWLESLQQEQAPWRPAEGLGGWLQPAASASRGIQPVIGPQPIAGQMAPEPPVNQPTQYPVGSIPIPTPRPLDIPRSIAVGDYSMPQVGEMQASQPDFADRLGAGFKSWAYTPVGNPFAALANAITGFNSGQVAAAPAARSPDPRLQSAARSQDDDAVAPPPSPAVRMQPIARTLARRTPALARVRPRF